MDIEREERDERFVADRLRLLDRDAAPCRQDLMDRSLRQAAERFARTRDDATDADESEVEARPAGQGANQMVAKALLAMTAVVAASILMIFGFVQDESKDDTLGAVLKRTVHETTLRLKLTKGGDEIDVWVRDPGMVRWQESPTRYQVASGPRRWHVDEGANTVTGDESPWFRDENLPVDLLAFLEFSPEFADRLRDARPVRVVEEEGRPNRFYRLRTSTGPMPLIVEALADVKSGCLRRITAWPGDRSPRDSRPLIQLRMVARDVSIDSSKFVVSESLSDDGRIGEIVDAQGIVSLRPVTGRRWTPVGGRMIVKPRDWLRTDARGANAVSVSMTSARKLIVGPGTLVELRGPDGVLLNHGELNVSGGAADGGPLRIEGPAGETVEIPPGRTAHYRVGDDGSLSELENKPPWLAGFEGSSNDESLGSLIANIDGRDVPLTIGTHSVKVEIRDQIARTTIEESFINHTDVALEGVFHFPLPQDASISGFGMWINGELVEADVVEKQRAREIYETILRERRDPALLEWTGGNIFKARVFPIQPRVPKRIRIVYTQVLPLRANRYRYSYGLRSEMLRKTPLRELSMEVLISSAIPLKSVNCPTHPVRAQVTRNSARLEFSEQEYTPTRDFEVVCEVDSKQSDVVVIPHRRGDDGYFLIQLTPPSAEGNWQREILPDGKPLKLLLVCDTSGSMDSDRRRLQQEFVNSVLSSLGPEDRFNLAVCDAECRWLHDQPVESTADGRDRALQWLSDRTSMGWTDLDRMAASVIDRVEGDSHVIYVGDGIVTAGDADPRAFVGRLSRLTSEIADGTFHAVSVGNSFESVVLKGIARVGGGSVREIRGEQTPQTVAMELLNEIAQPGLRDLKVEFRGLRVAQIYPNELPNLAAGTQQILIGRYLPEGEDQSGEIVISGTRDGQAVSYASRFALKDAEQGNSFLPRLWSRARLDGLLPQSGNSIVQDEIIALSEEFHIITPFTSLLVLETDEDRERFGVKRRYRMRDGERFFADGRDNATLELLQQAMKEAGDWRIALRRSVLRQLRGLGRDADLLQGLLRINDGRVVDEFRSMNGPVSTTGEFWLGDKMSGLASEVALEFGESLAKVENGVRRYGWELAEDGRTLEGLEAADKLLADFESVDEVDRRVGDRENASNSRADGDFFDRQQLLLGGDLSLNLESSLGLIDLRRKQSIEKFKSIGGRARGGYSRDYDYVAWLDTLFPAVPAEPSSTDAPEPTKWSDEAVAISNRLIRNLAFEDGGIEVRLRSRSNDPRWDRVTSVHEQLHLYSPERWLRLPVDERSQTIVQWCDGEERGAYSRAFQSGRVRKSNARDLASFQPGQRPYAVVPLHRQYHQYEAAVESAENDRATLVLTHRPDRLGASTSEIRIEIDTTRDVVLRVETRTDDRIVVTTRYDDFEEVAGAWWPRRIESFDEKDRPTSSTTQSVTKLTGEELTARLARELPDRDRVRLVSLPLPSTRNAEIASADGSARFEHRLVLLLKALLVQDWDEVTKRFEAIERLDPDRPVWPWMRASIHIAARRNEEARQVLQSRADALVAERTPDEWFLSDYILDQCSRVADNNEMLGMLDRLRPVHDRQERRDEAVRDWNVRYAQVLRGLNRIEELLPLQRAIATDAPWDANAQTTYARDLAEAGELEAAWAWLRQEIDREVERHEYERMQLRNAYASMLRQQGRDEELVRFLEETIAQKPTDSGIYLQYVSSLILTDRADEADQIVAGWLEEGRVEGRLEQDAWARLNAAVSYARGYRDRVHLNWIEPVWIERLDRTARFFLEHPQHFDIARTIVDNHLFVRTTTSDRLRADMARRLEQSAGEMDVELVSHYVRWLVDRDDLTDEQWMRIAQSLRGRWDEMAFSNGRRQLAETLVRIYARYSPDDAQLSFMRRRIERAVQDLSDERAAQRAGWLFDELLTRDWSEEREDEAFSLLERLSVSEQPSLTLSKRILALHKLNDRMLDARFQARMRELRDEGGFSELTRTELQARQEEYRQAAREALAEQLRRQLEAREAEADNDQRRTETFGEWLRWMRMERTYLQVQLDRDLDRVAATCWEILGDAPPEHEVAENDEGVDGAERLEAARMEAIESLLRHRALMTIANLAARRSAPAERVDRLLDYVDAGLGRGGESAQVWRRARYFLLIALDRPDQLERDLRAWIGQDPYPAPWRLALGRLSAERGEVTEAIRLFETVRTESPLGPSDHAALADWYLVADRREEYRRARIEVFKSSSESQLSSWLNRQRAMWNRRDGALPTELDEEVLFAFQALFEKSNRPENYVRQLKDFYGACRDFRLLRMVPDAVVGRTPQQVYGLLESLHSNLLEEVRAEATADGMLARLREARADTDSPLDLRALDLLESMIEARAAQVLNQPGPHVAASVAALRRAFERQWAEGEQRQMAGLLDSLGTIRHPELADERLRQLRQLHRLTTEGGDDRLVVAFHLAHALFWSHDRRDEAVAVTQIAVREFDRTHESGWPVHMNSQLSGFVELLEADRRFEDGQRLLDRQLEDPANEQQRQWLTRRGNQLFIRALEQDGRVSLGSGAELYRNLLDRMLRQTETRDDEHRRQLTSQLLELFRAAGNKKIEGFEQDLRAYATTQLPTILKRQMNDYPSIVRDTLRTVKELLGPRDALKFLIERFEDYPRRFEYTWEDGWPQFSYELARLHVELEKKIGDLEPRLLAIVLDALRYDLASGQSSYRNFYDDDHGDRFWKEKADDFARVAEEVLKQNDDSARIVAHIARYLYGGLDRRDRAIEVLMIADGKGLLDTGQRIVLCEYLHATGRHAESISILEPIVRAEPDTMRYRTMLITAYARSAREQQMRGLLAETDELFRQGGRWTESNVAQLARCCVDIDLHAEAVKYFDEAIAQRQRTRGDRGIGDQELVAYYCGLAEAHLGLDDTRAAVDAAASAVIARAERRRDGNSGYYWLERVITAAKDLDQYVQYLDRKAEETGQDSPLIRREVGRAFAKRGEHEKAIRQLRIAVTLQPTDEQTHQELIASLDALGDRQGAVRQLLALIDLNRHDLELYKDLARRLATDEALAERAATAVVEAGPTEAEHHQALAEIRQQQDRWPEAIEQWRHVVRLRSLEPDGLVRLAKAQIHLKHWAQAQETIDRLNRTEWPTRFSDLPREIRALQEQIPADL